MVVDTFKINRFKAIIDSHWQDIEHGGYVCI